MSLPALTLSGMNSELPSTLRNLARRQHGIISRSQALRAGLSADMIKFRISSSRWTQVHRGVYATFTGMPGRGAQLWSAVLAAGPGAALSHETAAELHRLADKPADLIHVAIPARSRADREDL
jgi:predicted transcriptional regulator of viral defense system